MVKDLYLAWMHNRRGLLSGEHLFLVSHLRSYSSLLGQLFGGHPEICGHGERQRSYHGPIDLFRARVALGATDASFAGQRFYLDRLVQTRTKLGTHVLLSHRCRLVFFARQPEPTLRSLVSPNAPRNERFATIEHAAIHYRARLETMVAMARQAECPRLHFPVESMMEAPDQNCAEIARWLGLSRPFSARYRPFEEIAPGQRAGSDGRARVGHAGGEPERDSAAVAISASCLRDCVDAYESYMGAMDECCDRLLADMPANEQQTESLC